MSDFENAALARRMAPLRRTAWVPVVQEGDGERGASKFSGQPWLAPGEAWPPCGNCGKPMQLFLQLRARDLPAAAGDVLEGGTFQLFYCTGDEPHCEGDCEAFFPNAASTLLRIVHPDEGEDGEPLAGGGPEDPFPPRRITGWTEAADYPDVQEIEEREMLDPPLGDEESGPLYDSGFARQRDKLLGWPSWVQGIEYPDCPECGRTMELLFQVDSEDHLPYMFGDVGTAHVTQCPAHRKRLAFGWACH